MSSYLNTIKEALLFFPIIAFIISIPFVLIQYHKFGSISFLKSTIIYSFVLYFICAYFLIILPLPSLSSVAKLTTPRVQLIPFSFIIDFIRHTSFDILNFSTYLPAIKESCFFVPTYNLLLTLPFGIYLRYYFECDLKKVIKYTFLLSLFFELTQLTGLYFIYSRGYRLFDIDDLMLNTLGGVIGYIICKPIINKLPKREKINDSARKKGKIISGLRRTIALFLDLFIFSFFEFVFSPISTQTEYFSIIILVIYYVLIPALLRGATLGEKFLNIRIVDYKDSINIIRLFFRKLLFIIIYFVIPFLICFGLIYLNKIDADKDIKKWVFIVGCGIIFLIYAITAIKYLFTNKAMLYEKISKTKLISTIGENEKV